MRIVGIDPGVTGALAFMVDGSLVDVIDMPIGDTRVAGWEIASALQDMLPDVVVVENTQPMPKNGSVPSFKLGLNTGIVLGVVQTLSLPLVRIRPVDWKRSNGLVGKDKNASRYLASELWPGFKDKFKLVKHDGRAEAALIARAHVIRNVQQASA